MACRGQKRRDSLSIKKLDPALKEAAERLSCLFKEAMENSRVGSWKIPLLEEVLHQLIW